MTITANDTDYGYAGNGTHVGSGYDVEVKRAAKTTALVCITEVASRDEWITTLDVEADQDMQVLAVEIANCPGFGDGGWTADSSDAWATLAVQWDAIEVSR